MTCTFECAICWPGCRLTTGEDATTPTGCPWPSPDNAPQWQVADYGEVGPA